MRQHGRHSRSHSHYHAGVQLIQNLAEEVDQLTSQVVAAAIEVRKDPDNTAARQKLDSLRKEWSQKVQQLTGAIDDVINPEDFTAVSGER